MKRGLKHPEFLREQVVKMTLNGTPYREVAEQLGVSISYACRVYRESGGQPRRAPARDLGVHLRDITTAVASGASVRQLAARWETDVKTMHRFLKANGLKTKGRTPRVKPIPAVHLRQPIF